MIGNNWIALIASFGLAILWLRLNDFLAHRGWISGPLSRKIIHIGTGPIFVLSWILFEDTPSAPWMAATVPLLITVQFALVGTGILKDPAAVIAMSRTGDRREILRGPLFYGIVFVVLTVVYWYRSPIGIIALMVLCGGDGLADVIGRRVKKTVLPWSPRKTVAGSLAVFAGSWIFSVFVLAVFIGFGILKQPLMDFVLSVTLIALAATLVESLPVRDVDNLTVPLTAVVLGHLIFR